MKNNKDYHLGLLYLVYLLICSDAEISEKELGDLDHIRSVEVIPSEDFMTFQESIIGKSEREIYQNGIDLINACDDSFKLRAFVRLFQMAQSDGLLHVKEVRLLLYAVKLAQVDFNTVITVANQEQV